MKSFIIKSPIKKHSMATQHTPVSFVASLSVNLSQTFSKTLSQTFLKGGVAVALAVWLSACGSPPSPNSSANNSTNTNANANPNANPNTGTAQQVELLNVSYDVSRDFYRDYNPLFVEHYQSQHPNVNVTVKQSHGGSSKQAVSVANGLQADVVTMNQSSDIDLLVDRGLVAGDWQSQFPNGAMPFSSAVVMLVREGNPKGISDWSDLSREGIEIVMPNPKVSGNGRYAYLAVYGFGKRTLADTAVTPYMRQVLNNVKVYENGGRSATTTFVQRGIGDVLITAENEANMVKEGFGQGKVQILYPSQTLEQESPVAIVKAVTDKSGNTEVARAYLEYLWSEPAQQLAVQMYLRPNNPSVLEAHRERFPVMTTYKAQDEFGSWADIMSEHFSEGGVFDSLASR